MKKLTALLLALAMIFALAACGSGGTAQQPQTSASAEAGVLRVAALYDITTMDVAQTTDNYMVPMNVFDRLFESQVQGDGSTAIVPSLCTEYKVSDDGLTYSFTLRDGVTFSNGSALTASDVQYTFERLLTAGGVNDDIPLEVKGGQALKDGKAKSLEGFAVTDRVVPSVAPFRRMLGTPSDLLSCHAGRVAGFALEGHVPALAIRRLLAETGFKLEKQLSVSHFRAAWVKRRLPLGFLVALDSFLQPSGAWCQYSPSVFSRARVVKTERPAPDGDFFACPVCRHPLPEAHATQVCPGCGHTWEYRDGIYEFRPNPES